MYNNSLVQRFSFEISLKKNVTKLYYNQTNQVLLILHGRMQIRWISFSRVCLNLSRNNRANFTAGSLQDHCIFNQCCLHRETNYIFATKE